MSIIFLIFAVCALFSNGLAQTAAPTKQEGKTTVLPESTTIEEVSTTLGDGTTSTELPEPTAEISETTTAAPETTTAASAVPETTTAGKLLEPDSIVPLHHFVHTRPNMSNV